MDTSRKAFQELTLDGILKELSKCSCVGEHVAGDGKILLGSLGGGKSRGWLHQIFAPHDFAAIDRFMQENSFLREFHHPKQWRHLNGCNLFAMCFSLYAPALVSAEPRIWRAYDVVFINLGERNLLSVVDGYIFGGSSCMGRELFYVELRDESVIALDRDTSKRVYTWPSYEVFLKAELNRLSRVWGSDGMPPADFLYMPFEG